MPPPPAAAAAPATDRPQPGTSPADPSLAPPSVVLLAPGVAPDASVGSPAPEVGPLRAGLPAALWALGTGLAAVGLPVLVIWAADPRSTADALTAVRAAGQVWLMAHGVPMGLGAGRLFLVPLGLLLVPLALLVWAGGLAARQHRVTTLREAASLAAAVAGPYSLAAAGLAVLSTGGGVRPSVLGALVGASALALVGAGAGVLRLAQLDDDEPRLPPRLRRLLLPAGTALLALLGAGALLAGVQLALSAGPAANLARAGGAGAVGGLGLLAVELVLVPNAVIWAASWWAGPGFAVGAGTSVGPLASELGPVPALPLLAALPAGGLPLEVGLLALLVPLTAGALAGRLLARTGAAVRDAALCGLLTGALFALLAALSSGSAGSGRMSDLGPSAWQVGLAVALEVTVAAALTAWLVRRRAARRDASELDDDGADDLVGEGLLPLVPDRPEVAEQQR